ncbi:hypothetical protein N566_02270 [Streptomycetaceae bacterium MP113-05]|nr:hypothetical protein N566_02270 [Streptomycetaceae bacterium MP113-05]
MGVGAVLVLIAAGAVAYDSASASSAGPEDPSARPNPVAAPASGSPAREVRPSPTLTDTALLPDLVGTSLQQARAATEKAGFSLSASRDATDQARVQIAEHAWKVCAQNPLPGTHPISVKVEFTAVKREETCPG